jgi:FdhE protein
VETVNLAAIGEKYPFLKANLMFWERYIQARADTAKLLGRMIDLPKLKETGFPGSTSTKPILASLKLSFSAEQTAVLLETFSRTVGIDARSFPFPNPVPLFEELNSTTDTEGFVLAEVHASIAAFVESAVADDREAIYWMEPFCPICGSNAALGLITPSGKKNLVCSHCHTVWSYMRTACGLCGHAEERGTTFLSTEELPGWMIETCDACGYYLKVCDMRNTLPDIIAYPLLYLTTWEMDLSVRDKEYAPAFFKIFERADWIRLKHAN